MGPLPGGGASQGHGQGILNCGRPGIGRWLLKLGMENALGIGVRVALTQLKLGVADSASWPGQPQTRQFCIPSDKWEMAPVLTLQLRIRQAQGIWILCWLLALTGGLTILCSGHLLVQLWPLGTFLASSCPFPVLPQVALAAGLVGAEASRASLDAGRYPPWRRALGPLLVAGTAGGGGLLIIALGLALGLPGSLGTGLEEGLGSALAHYKDTEVPGQCHAKRLMDELQLRYHCCGRHGYKDWFGIQWVSSRYLDPNDQDVVDRIHSNVESLYLTDGVPFSCCNPHSPQPCLQSRLSDPHAHHIFEPRQPTLNLWVQGCHGVLMKYLQGLTSTLCNMLAGTFLLQTLVLLGLRYLQTVLEELGGFINGEGESQGYLLPSRLKDMLKKAWLQGGAAHRPAPEAVPPEETPPDKGLAEA